MENTEEMKAKKKAAQRLTTGIIIGMTGSRARLCGVCPGYEKHQYADF